MVENSSPRPGRYPNLNVAKVGTHCRSDEDNPSTDAVSGAGRTPAARCFSSSASLRRSSSTLGGSEAACPTFSSEVVRVARTLLSASAREATGGGNGGGVNDDGVQAGGPDPPLPLAGCARFRRAGAPTPARNVLSPRGPFAPPF